MTARVARRRARRSCAAGSRISAAALVGLAGVYVLALRYTPVEARQGLAQKIFYLHVPAAWCALLAFSLVGIASALYLWLHDPRLDRFAAASAEVGVAFSAVMLTTGPDLGQADLGHLVDLGRAAHAHAVPLFPLRRLPGAPRRGARSGRAGPVQRGGGHPGHAAGALHSPERLSVPDAPPAARRAQAERAVAAAGDAAHAADLDAGVHPAVHRAGDDALRPGPGRGGARRGADAV